MLDGFNEGWIEFEDGEAGSRKGEIALETVLKAVVEREMFNRLIRSKVDRTIDCCREALGRAKDKAGLRLQDIDYIVLVGGSSRVPLVRDTVRAAFGNADLPEHVRHLDPLLHEPDLCVAYGAALRAATQGKTPPTRAPTTPPSRTTPARATTRARATR